MGSAVLGSCLSPPLPLPLLLSRAEGRTISQPLPPRSDGSALVWGCVAVAVTTCKLVLAQGAAASSACPEGAEMTVLLLQSLEKIAEKMPGLWPVPEQTPLSAGLLIAAVGGLARKDRSLPGRAGCGWFPSKLCFAPVSRVQVRLVEDPSKTSRVLSRSPRTSCHVEKDEHSGSCASRAAPEPFPFGVSGR